jgi:hypothetical protein
MLTILQISDLHRSDAARVSNELLLSSLLSDIEKHSKVSPRISKCNVIVVTGDLVAGVAVGTPNAGEVLRKQYSQAKDFLQRLCKEILGGDLRRIFIVPGNHDVSWLASKESMEKVEGIRPSDVRGLLARENSQYRWSWQNLSLYQVKSRGDYAKRLTSFKEFFDDFYRGLGVKFNLEEHSQTINYVTPDGRALFTGFSSLYENDCFNLQGRISVDDLSSNNLFVGASDMNKIPLKIAFWHHSIESAGFQDDHLNTAEILPRLIDRGYVLGLHGHQHRSDVVSYAFRLTPKMVMPIVASGSLCAGPGDIPPGYRRQYNVIELDENRANARVHVREWFNDTVWIGASLLEFHRRSYLDVPLPILRNILRESQGKLPSMTSQAVQDAEIAARNKDYSKVLLLLANVSPEIPIVRKLMIEALHILGRWKELTDFIKTPTNSEELALIVDGMMSMKEFADARRILDECSTDSEKYDRGFIDELKKRLVAKGDGGKK